MNRHLIGLTALLGAVLVVASACSTTQESAAESALSLNPGFTEEELFSVAVESIMGEAPPAYFVDYSKQIALEFDQEAIINNYDCDNLASRFGEMLVSTEAAGLVTPQQVRISLEPWWGRSPRGLA